MWRSAVFASLLILLSPAQAFAEAEPAHGIAVLMYHRFGDDRYPQTNTPLAQLDAHIAELRREKYSVLPLPEIIARLRAGETLPPRTVAITIDDAYRSTYELGWPRFKAAGLPITLFAATDPLDDRQSDYMSWDQIRELAAEPLATVAHHSKSHAHLPAASADVLKMQLEEANARFKAELGFRPEIFAYPYGEYGQREIAAARALGFSAAFGQQSSALQPPRDEAAYFELPRFALNEAYGEIDRFRQLLNVIPLRVSEVTPRETVLKAAEPPPPYGFTIDQSVGPLDGLACYVNQGIGHRMEILGRRVEVRFDSPFPPGRVRVNCTLYAGEGRWRWFGRLFTVLKD
jgi:peptidoglycan/xylan/chitin deacetylase (PgdA/CDA1 family)